MNPAVMSLLLGGGSALVNSIFGGKDKWEMSPEQRALYQSLMGQYNRGEFGYSPTEKMAMQKKLKGEIGEETESATGRSLASLGRRGVLGAGEAAGVATGIQSAGAEALGRGYTEIELQDAAEKRRRKAELEAALMGTSRGQFQEGTDFSGDLGEMSGNLMYYYLMKGKNPEEAGETGWRPKAPWR